MADKPKKILSLNDLTDRYNSAFGYSAMKIAPRIQQFAKSKSKWFLNVPAYSEPDTSYAEIMLQNLVSGDVYLFGIDQIENGTPAFPFQTKKPNVRKYMAPPPMVSFSRSKNVVRSPIDRSNAEVIENFGNKSYEIKFQGIIIDMDDHLYPSDLMKQLHELFESAGTYKVVSDIFADLGINELFFSDGFNIDFVEGYIDTVKFSVNAVSVEPAEFIIL